MSTVVPLISEFSDAPSAQFIAGREYIEGMEEKQPTTAPSEGLEENQVASAHALPSDDVSINGSVKTLPRLKPKFYIWQVYASESLLSAIKLSGPRYKTRLAVN